MLLASTVSPLPQLHQWQNSTQLSAVWWILLQRRHLSPGPRHQPAFLSVSHRLMGAGEGRNISNVLCCIFYSFTQLLFKYCRCAPDSLALKAESKKSSWDNVLPARGESAGKMSSSGVRILKLSVWRRCVQAMPQWGGLTLGHHRRQSHPSLCRKVFKQIKHSFRRGTLCLALKTARHGVDLYISR